MTDRGEVRPLVSVVVPMLDELGAIDRCLDGFEAQTYPLEALEVLVVDGGSTDGSRQVVDERARTSSWIRVLDNPARKAAAAFNVGVAGARGEVVCLFSAHGVPDPSYVEASVRVLRDTGADGVGGRYLHVGSDPVSNAIGAAMVSPFGMASPHRFARERQEADTISHPAYRKAALDSVGRFDETLERNSDYELNWRLREQGSRLLFAPEVVSIYRPRASIRKLSQQFWWYGRWKERVIRRHPRSLRARHLVPPAAVLAAALTPALVLTRSGRRLVGAGAVGYGAMLGAAVVQAKPADHDASVLAFLACLPVMHASWGAGFLTSVIEDTFRRPPNPPSAPLASGSDAGSAPERSPS